MGKKKTGVKVKRGKEQGQTHNPRQKKPPKGMNNPTKTEGTKKEVTKNVGKQRSRAKPRV